MEPAAECMLVLIGATPEGKKEFVGFQTGVCESAQSWLELLIDIKQRGFESPAAPMISAAYCLTLSGRFLLSRAAATFPVSSCTHQPGANITELCYLLGQIGYPTSNVLFRVVGVYPEAQPPCRTSRASPIAPAGEMAF